MNVEIIKAKMKMWKEASYQMLKISDMSIEQMLKHDKSQLLKLCQCYVKHHEKAYIHGVFLGLDRYDIHFSRFIDHLDNKDGMRMFLGGMAKKLEMDKCLPKMKYPQAMTIKSYSQLSLIRLAAFFLKKEMEIMYNSCIDLAERVSKSKPNSPLLQNTFKNPIIKLLRAATEHSNCTCDICKPSS